MVLSDRFADAFTYVNAVHRNQRTDSGPLWRPRRRNRRGLFRLFGSRASGGKEWRACKERYHEHARQTADLSVLLVSAADKLHNARATLADLHRIGPGVWDRFTGDPRVRQLAAELDPIVKALEEY